MNALDMKKTIAITVLCLAFVSFGTPTSTVLGAGDLADGSLIKSDAFAAVYYYSGGKRYVFPNSKTYFTWYEDFSGVVTVSPTSLANIPLGGNVTFRPGKSLVKIVSSPNVYAVAQGGVLRWVKTEQAAREMYGADWNTKVSDIPDAFFVNYSIDYDRPIESGADFSPSAEIARVVSIAQDKGLSGSGTIPPAPAPTSTGLIQPSDFSYRGAFRLPTDPAWMGWEWGGDAMTYYPGGDPSGSADGYPGSLYGTGHAWNMNVSEIGIPAPVISAGKNPENLNRAVTLQDFTDVRGGLFDPLTEIIRVGMAYLPAQGSQTRGKLYLAFGQHFQEEGSEQLIPSHMWCDLDLTGTQGAWWVDGENIYSVNDYLFDIPSDWAAAHVGGRMLASGRYRDGGWSGQGPAIYAIAPWNYGNPPAPGTHIQPVTLLQYDTSYENDALFSPTARTLDGYHHTDTWTGASWLTAGGKSAVAFVGTKGYGEYWYGDINGPCLDCELQRGWWSDRMVAEMILYDPADLAAVAAGTMEPWEPQPYATVDLEPYMFRNESDQVMFQVGAMAFDRDRGLLYLFETLVDEDRPIVHVWKVN